MIRLTSLAAIDNLHAHAPRSTVHAWVLLPGANSLERLTVTEEQRVIEWITQWVGERPELALETDPAGNLVVGFRTGGQAASGTGSSPPLI